MGLIDADKVNPSDVFVGISDFATDCRNAVVKLLAAQPTIDPIHAAGGCYCRECKHWENDDDTGYCTNPDGLDNYALPTDFCSYGMRRDNNVETD